MVERNKLSDTVAGVSSFEKAILGTTFLGERVFSSELWKYYR